VKGRGVCVGWGVLAGASDGDRNRSRPGLGLWSRYRGRGRGIVGAGARGYWVGEGGAWFD